MNEKALCHSDWRNIFRLVSECRELGDDHRLWRTHLMTGLGRLVDAEIVMQASLSGVRECKVEMHDGLAWGFEHGFNLKGWLQVLEMYGPSLQSDFFHEMLRLSRSAPETGTTRSRQFFLTDIEWERSFDYQMIARTIGTDAVIQSQYWVKGQAGILDGLTVSRAAGRTQFDDREVAIVHCLHAEIADLIGGPLAGRSDRQPSELAPRVRQVLQGLLEGESDKQIALRLNLSSHTINQYTKSIYRYFQVSSRAELLARWIKRGWTLYPSGWTPPANVVTY